MKSKAFFLLVFLIVSLVLPLYQTPNVKAQEPYHELSVSVDEMFYLHGEIAKVTVQSNASISVTLNVFYPNGSLAFSGDKTTDETGYAIWNLPISEAMPYGTYSFKANVTDFVSETWATVLDVSGWSPTSFPYNRVWRGINYTLKAKGFIAEGFDSTLNLTLPYFDWYSSLTVKAFENSMCFLERVTHEASGLKVDLTYAFIHCGVKIIINGSIPEPTEFTFKFVSPRTIKKHLDGLKTGHLRFDWSDMRKAKQAFSYNKTSHKLTVTIPQTFKIDPVIFEDGFESGDFTAWDGTSGSPEVTSSLSHCGTYSANMTFTNTYQTIRCYEDFGTSYDTVYIRAYFRMTDIPDASGEQFMLLKALSQPAYSTLYNIFIDYDSGVKFQIQSYVPSTQTHSSAVQTVVADTWYCLEVKYYKHATEGEYRLYFEGDSIVNRTNVDTSAQTMYRMDVGRSTDNPFTDFSIFWDCVVIDDERINCEAAGVDYVADLTQSLASTWAVLTEWDAIADITQSLTTSWSVLTEWDAILDVTQALTTSWNILANLNTFVDLSQAIATTWVILTQWNAILDLAQSLATSWTVLTQTNFNIIASLSNTFTWVVDVVRTVGGVAYIADLSQAISTTWNVLTQWNSIVDLTQALSTTWTVLIQSSFNIVTSLSNTFTWTVDILKGVITDHIVDLSLSVVTSWIVDLVHTPWTTIYATKGFVLATIMLGLLIGLPLLALIIWRKKQ